MRLKLVYLFGGTADEYMISDLTSRDGDRFPGTLPAFFLRFRKKISAATRSNSRIRTTTTGMMKLPAFPVFSDSGVDAETRVDEETGGEEDVADSFSFSLAWSDGMDQEKRGMARDVLAQKTLSFLCGSPANRSKPTENESL